METIFSKDGQLNTEFFDKNLLKSTSNLNDILSVTNKTHSSFVESTHILIVLTHIPDGITQNLFRDNQITPRELEEGLINCIDKEQHFTPNKILKLEIFNDSAKKIFQSLDNLIKNGRINTINEKQLLIATLQNLTPAVIDSLRMVQLSPQNLIKSIEEEADIPDIEPFVNDSINLKAFSHGGIRVLELMKTEAEALGYSQMDPRHLLLSLLEFEGGATQIALYQQNIIPQKVQERLMINLRARASKNLKQLHLKKEYLTPTVIVILKQAAEVAKIDRANLIAEVHILRVFLNNDTFALRRLEDAGVQLNLVRDSAKQFEATSEPVPESTSASVSIKEIKSFIKAYIVGQDDVIDLCLPFLRRLLFGFRRPGKTAGVLLFCGPSGSGKTEMAKSIARAIFGSEDNLIMLEMGQFQTKESMNIFVGAPPGYVGYGEGKLTNGLRNKPRSVVLFDEIEKAHPQVFDALLRFIDEGKIDDPAGPIRDGSECIIVMTSNVRTSDLANLVEGDGYSKNKWEIKRKLRKALLNVSVKRDSESSKYNDFYFRQEFINRIDEIVLFRILNENDLAEIALRNLDVTINRLKEEKQISLFFGENQKMKKAAARQIGHFCNTLDEGARAILRVVHTAVLDPVIDFITENACSPPISLGIQLIHDKDTKEPRGIVDFFESN